MGNAKGMKAWFGPAVPRIIKDQKRFIEKYLFRFGLRDAMLVSAFTRVAFVPLKAINLHEINHFVYSHNIQNDSRRRIQHPMKKSWRGIFLIAGVGVVVPWWMSGFEPSVLGYWLQVAFALLLASGLVSPAVNFIERRYGERLAVLAMFMLLPEIVLFFHFILFPTIEGWFS